MEFSINDYLLDENLIHIFVHLSKTDRLECRAVCQRWFNLLSTRTTFQSDWSLHLNDSVIEPNTLPFTTIMNSQIRYQSLSMNVNLTIADETDKFWQKLGKTVTCLSLIGKVRDKLQTRLIEVIKYFNNVQTLIIDDSYTVLNELRSMPDVERLVLKDLSFQDAGSFQKSIEKFPKLSSLHLNQINHLTLPMLVNTRKIQSAVVNFDEVRDFYQTPDKAQVMMDLSHILDGNLKRLSFISRNNDTSILRNIVKENQKITEIKLVWSGFPTELSSDGVMKCVINPQLITELDLWLDFCSASSPSFEILESIKNLQKLKLTVKNSDVGCFFGHKVLNLHKLRKLSYTFFKSNVCSVCQEYLISSCPLLESLNMDLGENFMIQTILTELRALRKLKLRKISCKNFTSSLTLVEESHIPSLKHLDLEYKVIPDKDWSINALSLIEYLRPVIFDVQTLILKRFPFDETMTVFEQSMYQKLPHLKLLNADYCRFLSKNHV